ncbi:mercuric reductase [Zeaxanthinibacter sp. PT1]|uniref:mercuric reductase n=1 Tax=Zeaxanthinibacter TaxID=561554 RepID=UPI00234B45BB|nr:mercuric reductase [Zeaxanthinibacter sp. PT1]MDC6350488.1 mercuric reductase [Zeaxanthinibacter sp. PT1]
MKKFDNIIIGSGQAGTPLAFTLASKGQSVAFIEKEHYGGTCLNTGCTPTKAYVASARRIWDSKHGDELGIYIPEGATANLHNIKARKDSLITGSVDGIKDGIKKNNKITAYWGEVRFTGNKEVFVNGETLTADRIFINVGGRPRIPGAYATAGPLTNKSLLELTELPEHLVVVGGGYIGLEFGQMFARFGSKVTIVERGSRIIDKEDEDVSEAIQEALEADGVNFRLNATCMGAKRLENGQVEVTVNCDSGAPKVTGSHVLLAIGRNPNGDLLNLEKTGVKTDERGFITVNDTLETNVEGIYALGDCNGEGAFTHTAYNDFQIVQDQLFGDGQRRLSDRITTYGLFVDPPLGRVGMTLTQAKESGKKILTNTRPMSKVARAKEKGETRGLMRVIVDADTEKILGASILGTGGDEVIQGITNLMYAGASYKVLRDSVQIHPTVSELLPTLLEGLKAPE